MIEAALILWGLFMVVNFVWNPGRNTIIEKFELAFGVTLMMGGGFVFWLIAAAVLKWSWRTVFG